MLCISVDLYAQQSTSYHYDAAGNRIKREIIISKKQAVAAPKTKAPSYSDMLSDYQIRIAPNPTKGPHPVLNLGGQVRENITILIC